MLQLIVVCFIINYTYLTLVCILLYELVCIIPWPKHHGLTYLLYFYVFWSTYKYYLRYDLYYLFLQLAYVMNMTSSLILFFYNAKKGKEGKLLLLYAGNDIKFVNTSSSKSQWLKGSIPSREQQLRSLAIIKKGGNVNKHDLVLEFW